MVSLIRDSDLYRRMLALNSDEKRKVWMRYDVAEDGLPDSMKVDSQGNIYGAGPGERTLTIKLAVLGQGPAS